MPFLRRYDWVEGQQFLGNMWAIRKGKRAVLCALWTHPFGWELRLVNDQQVVRRQVCKQALEILSVGEAWRAEVEHKDWRPKGSEPS